jgi:hypothetical protein
VLVRELSRPAVGSAPSRALNHFARGRHPVPHSPRFLFLDTVFLSDITSRRPSALSCLLFGPASRAASRQAESRRLDPRCPHVAGCARFLRLPSILIRGPVPWFNRLPPVLSGSSWFWLRFVNRAQQSACPLASVFCAANPGIPLGIRSHRPLAQQAIASRARASISLPLFSLSPVLLKRCRSLVGSFRFCSVFPPLA